MQFCMYKHTFDKDQHTVIIVAIYGFRIVFIGLMSLHSYICIVFAIIHVKGSFRYENKMILYIVFFFFFNESLLKNKWTKLIKFII